MNYTHKLKDSYTINTKQIEEFQKELIQNSIQSLDSIEIVTESTPEGEILEMQPYQIYKGEKQVADGVVSFTPEMSEQEREEKISMVVNDHIENLTRWEEMKNQEILNENQRISKLISHGVDVTSEEIIDKKIQLPNGWPVTFIINKYTRLEELRQLEEASQYTLEQVIEMHTPKEIDPSAPLPPDTPATPFAWMVLEEERLNSVNSNEE